MRGQGDHLGGHLGRRGNHFRRGAGVAAGGVGAGGAAEALSDRGGFLCVFWEGFFAHSFEIVEGGGCRRSGGGGAIRCGGRRHARCALCGLLQKTRKEKLLKVVEKYIYKRIYNIYI